MKLSMNLKSLIVAALIGFASLQSQASYVGIHAAASQGDLAALKKYLTDDPRLISSRNGPGRTPLCVAAMCGQTNALEFLLSQRAEVNDRGFQQMTPLADMAAYGTTNDQQCTEVAAILLGHGAAVDPLVVVPTQRQHGYETHRLAALFAIQAPRTTLTPLSLSHAPGHGFVDKNYFITIESSQGVLPASIGRKSTGHEVDLTLPRVLWSFCGV